MFKYKIMIIDDEIDSRIGYLTDFFTNNAINSRTDLSDDLKSDFGKMLETEYEMVIPEYGKDLREFIESNSVDAYFLDVFLNEENTGWSITKALTFIKDNNPDAPIFVYSANWKDEAVIEDVSAAFREAYDGRTATYSYNLEKITRMVENLRSATAYKGISKVVEERKYIKRMINIASKKTIMAPHSDNGDIVILHISDLQYGDKNYTRRNMDIWKNVAGACNKLVKSGDIKGVDLVAITGDIAMRGRENEFNEAKKDLEDNLFKKLWGKDYIVGKYKGHVLPVPGNHDYDLNFCTMGYLEPQGAEDGNRRYIDLKKTGELLAKNTGKKTSDCDYEYLGFEAYRGFAHNINGNEHYYTKCSKNLNFIDDRFLDWNIRVICLNTCSGINASVTNGVVIDKGDLKRIVNKCEGDYYTLILSHHAPLPKDGDGEEWRKGLREDCISLINATRDNGGVWLGGHRHIRDHGEEYLTEENWFNIYEAPSACLDETWDLEDQWEIRTKDGKTLKTHRGFQVIKLKRQQEGLKVLFEPEVRSFFFDEDGVPHEAKMS